MVEIECKIESTNGQRESLRLSKVAHCKPRNGFKTKPTKRGTFSYLESSTMKLSSRKSRAKLLRVGPGIQYMSLVDFRDTL